MEQVLEAALESVPAPLPPDEKPAEAKPVESSN
jgi:hypothetical protein